MKFQKYVQDAEQFIRQVAEALGDPGNIDRAEKVTRAVLHTFRNEVPPQESLQMIAQLPMLIKAIYVDGWQIRSGRDRTRNLSDFIQAVREAERAAGFPYFEGADEIEKSIRAVFTVIGSYVSEGQMQDLQAVLPEELKPLLVEE